MTDRTTEVLIIGAGPGGYVCAIRAAQLGKSVTVVDPQAPGGTCLNVGCIPSKALIHAADEFAAAVSNAADGGRLGIRAAAPTIDLGETMAWKDTIVSRLNRGVGGLFTKAGVELISGTATFIDGKTVSVATADGESVTVRADHVVIATGSAPIEVPSLPFTDRVISSTGALALAAVPERIAVVGGGYIGLELGTALAKLGSAVTVVESEERVLSAFDRRLTRPVERSLVSLGITVLTNAKAIEDDGGALVIETENGRGVVEADVILVTVGRRPVTDRLGLEGLGLTMDGGFVAVDSAGQTSMKGVWAIGDVTGEPMLAHRAMKQGEVAAEAIAGIRAAFEPVAIPAVVFTDPEIVSVGLAPDEAKAEHGAIIEGRFMLAANARTMTLEADTGFVRTVARADDHVVVGIQAVGRHVSELSAAMGLAIEMGARVEDLTDTVFAHPTVGEAIPEAAMAALGNGLHA